jgi:hypothetical protein
MSTRATYELNEAKRLLHESRQVCLHHLKPMPSMTDRFANEMGKQHTSFHEKCFFSNAKKRLSACKKGGSDPEDPFSKNRSKARLASFFITEQYFYRLIGDQIDQSLHKQRKGRFEVDAISGEDHVRF